MSVEVETRSRARFFRRGVRRLLNANSPQRPSDAVALVSTTPVAPVHAMFQDARNTNIRRATFNIYGSGASTSAPSSSDSATLQQSTSGLLVAETSVPTNVIALSAHSVLPTDPIPTPLTSPETYVHHLITKNRGYPLWIPSPNMRLPACYRASGVRIGDVGIITPEGAFSFLFNVFHEATHAINASIRLPVDFVPFTRDSEANPCHIDEFKESSAGSYLADESLVRMDEGNDRLKTVLKTSAAHAAVLMMPEPVYASKVQSTAPLQKYVRNNIQSWYKFVRTVLGLEVNNGDLRVVYGCRKSAAFGIATVSNSTHRRGSESDSEAPSTELTFSIDDSWTEVTGCKYRWHHRGSAEVKAGPSLDENRDIQRDVTSTSNLQSDPIVNQCLFVSTIDFTLSEHEWQRVICDDPVSLTASQCPSRLSSSSVYTHSAPSGGRQSGSSHSSVSESGSGQRSNSASPEGALNCDPHGRVDLWPSIPKRPFHPSDIVAQFLLRVVPHATSVALCSDDWGAYMTDSVQNVAALIDGILSANEICDDNGMVYLTPKSRAPSTDSFPTTRLSPANQWQYIPNPLPGLNVEQTWRTLSQPVHDIADSETLLVEEHNVRCAMTLTKTPSLTARLPRIIIELSDLVASLEELIQALDLRSILRESEINFPRHRDGRHVVYGKGSGSNSSALANNVRKLIKNVHIREERRAPQQQDIARTPSGMVSDCSLEKLADWRDTKAQYGLGFTNETPALPYIYDYCDAPQQPQTDDLASWTHTPDDPASPITTSDAPAASSFVSGGSGSFTTHDPVSFATLHPLPVSVSPASAISLPSISAVSSTSTAGSSAPMPILGFDTRPRVNPYSRRVSALQHAPMSWRPPPKPEPSAWQLYFNDWLEKQQALGTRKLNFAQAVKDAGQEKEPYKRRSQSMKDAREMEDDAYKSIQKTVPLSGTDITNAQKDGDDGNQVEHPRSGCSGQQPHSAGYRSQSGAYVGYSASQGFPARPLTVQKYGPHRGDAPFFSQPTRKKARKALIIGIDYEPREWMTDVDKIQNLLIDHYEYKKEDIVILTDNTDNPQMQPTRSNIIAEMQKLVNETRPSDSMVLYFAGHSARRNYVANARRKDATNARRKDAANAQLKDTSGNETETETDGYNEVIYPVDHKSAGCITDNDLYHILVEPLPARSRLAAIVDSCHSGTLSDLPHNRCNRSKAKEPNIGSVKVVSSDIHKAEILSKAIKTSSAHVISWSGSEDDQGSTDDDPRDAASGGGGGGGGGRKATGAMSFALISVLCDNKQCSHQELFISIQKTLREKYGQNAALSSSHSIDTNVFLLKDTLFSAPNTQPQL